MKKYLLLFTFLVFTVHNTFCQDILNFNATPGNITINTPVTWNAYDVIIVNGIISIESGGSLTIEPNTTGPNAGAGLPVKVIFNASTYGITVTGTGSLNVSGTPSRNVYFNADKNFNGTFETGETWRNIWFNGSTGSSIIEYSIVENGRGNSIYGGGVNITATNVTVKNSVVRYCSATSIGGGILARPNPAATGIINIEKLTIYNNSAQNGGGIYLNPGVTISGCEIYNNSATTDGAGVYMRGTGSIINSRIYNHASGNAVFSYDNSTGYITNCVISNNSTGIRFGGAKNVINTNIINNTVGVLSGSATAPKLVNTVLWGNGTEYTINTSANLELAYCAIEGGLTGLAIDGGGNKSLSSSNTDLTGPNFVNQSSDFHINSWVSPLVDGGTASYAGLTFPSSDTDGESALMVRDIGIDEFFYYIWSGTSSSAWSNSSNWVGSPSTVPSIINENKIIIPSGRPFYPETDNLILQNRSRLIIEPRAGLTVTGETNVGSGCSFIMESDATGSANFITGTSVSGNYSVELFLSGGGAPDYKWHYVTTPVDNSAKSVLTSAIGNTYNLLNFIESNAVTSKNEGWNWHDGSDGSTAFTELRTDFGYNVYVNSDQTAHFTGTILPGADYINAGITCSGTNTVVNGWNLIGNPFTSAIDLDNMDFGLDVDRVIYMTKNNGYSYYNIETGEAIQDPENPNPYPDILAPMQGFFIHVNDGFDQYVIIPSVSRVLSNQTLSKGSNQNFKSKSIDPYPIIKLNIGDESSLYDETLLYFFPDATNNFDRKYDGYKMFSENLTRPQIYTTNNTVNFGMNGLPYPEVTTAIPLRIRLGETKNYTINVSRLENLSNYNITLIHGSNTIDLKANPSYTFPGVPGTINNMSIQFENIATAVNDVLLKKDQIACWYMNNQLYIRSNSSEFENESTVSITDITGKVVFERSNLKLNNNEIVEFSLYLNEGLYISTIKNNKSRITRKFLVSK